MPITLTKRPAQGSAGRCPRRGMYWTGAARRYGAPVDGLSARRAIQIPARRSDLVAHCGVPARNGLFDLKWLGTTWPRKRPNGAELWFRVPTCSEPRPDY